MNKDLFGNAIKDKMHLKDWFIVPPFSILNSSSQEWQDKKKKLYRNIVLQ